MTAAEVLELLAKVAIEIGPASAEALRKAIAGERPELLETPPPPRQDTAIQAEDEDLIRKRWPKR